MKKLIILLLTVTSFLTYSCNNDELPDGNTKPPTDSIPTVNSDGIVMQRAITNSDGSTTYSYVEAGTFDTVGITISRTLKQVSYYETTQDSFRRKYVKPNSPTDPSPPNPEVPAGYSLIYSTGYDKVADLDPWGNNQIGNGLLSTNTYKTGPASFKSVPANVSSGIRSEVQYPDYLTPRLFEGRIEYDVMYETIFQNSGHSLQFHPLTSGGSASPGLWHENGTFLWVNWINGTNYKYPTNYKIPQSRWIHCILDIKFSTTSSGYIKYSVDGVVILNKTSIRVGDGSGQYLKVGVNMWQNQSSIVYYDNLKIYKKV